MERENRNGALVKERKAEGRKRKKFISLSTQNIPSFRIDYAGTFYCDEYLYPVHCK